MRLFHTMALGLLAATLAGCASNNDESAPRYGEAKSTLPRVLNPDATPTEMETLGKDERAFTARLYAELRKDQGGKNVFFSPLSVFTAFGMLQAGARGESEAAIAKALSYSLPQARLHVAMNALDLALASRAKGGEGFKLTVANSSWAQSGLAIEAPYLDVLAQQYGAGVNTIDFSSDPQGAVKTINTWVANKTENRITDLLDSLERDTALVLVNAVYFNANWAEEFQENATADGTFQAPAGPKTVKMMHASAPIPTRFVRTERHDAVAIPYKNREVEMLAVMPAAGTLDSYESALDAKALDEVLGSLTSREVKLSMPRFTIKGESVSLKPALTSLGADVIFDAARADLSGITRQTQLYVDDVLHQAFVKVNEKGTEAAAATAIVARATSAPIDPPIELTLDRPFLFFIRDVATGAILFFGRVVDPVE